MNQQKQVYYIFDPFSTAFLYLEYFNNEVIANVIIIANSTPHHRLRRSPAPMGADMWYKH